jgi:YggT family protein
MLLSLVITALEILKWLIIARALMSWFMSPYSDNPVARLLRKVTDPILRPLSEVIPPLGGMDISPLVAFFAIQLTQTMLMRL